jgi:hypothetical protein
MKIIIISYSRVDRPCTKYWVHIKCVVENGMIRILLCFQQL